MSDLKWVMGGIAFAVLLGVLSGSYPAFMLSAFNPIATLRELLRQAQRRCLEKRPGDLSVYHFAS